MIGKSYDYIPFGNETYQYYYYFESEGDQGKIPKIVTFTLLPNGFWNLGFGDLQNGKVNDSVISNNYDIVKLIGTVAKIAYEFSDEFPRRGLEISPVDEKRKSLYNHVFRRHYETIHDKFLIIGISNNEEELYSPKKNLSIK